MEFIIQFPAANAIKFTRDGVIGNRRAAFDQQRFAETIHNGMDERRFFQPFEQSDPLRPQFFSNFPLMKLYVIDCDDNVIDEYNPTLVRKYTQKMYRSDAKFTSIDGKLFVYFDHGFEYSDEDFEVPGDFISHEGRLPNVYFSIGNIVRFNIQNTGFQFGVVENILWDSSLQAEGLLINTPYNIGTPVDGHIEVRYNEKPADLFGSLIDLSVLNGIYRLKLEAGLTEFVVSYTSEPIDVRDYHEKSLSIGYRHEGTFDDVELWEYLYLSDWTNVIRVPSNFNLLTPSGEMDVYNDDYGTREQLRASAYREMVFRAYNQPTWIIDKFNVAFGHDTLIINDVEWRPSDFGSSENIENTDLNTFEISLRQKEDRRLFSSSVVVEVTASFTPDIFNEILAVGDTLVSQFNTNTGKVFRFISLPSWVTADVEEFEDGDFIEFTVVENVYDEEREITITAFSFEITEVTAQITFNQMAGESEMPGLIDVNPGSLSFRGVGEIKNVLVTTDSGVQFQAISSASWLTVSGAIRTDTQNVSISASANNTEVTRYGSVTFININDSSDTLTVTVSQSAIEKVNYIINNTSSSGIILGVSAGPVDETITAISLNSGSFPVMVGTSRTGFSTGTGDVEVFVEISGGVTLNFLKNGVLVNSQSAGGGVLSFTFLNLNDEDTITINLI